MKKNISVSNISKNTKTTTSTTTTTTTTTTLPHNSNEFCEKRVVFCEHGFVICYDITKYATGLPTYSCGHFHWGAEEMNSIQDIIEKIETIKQPQWYKRFHIWKFHFSLVKYP